VSSQTGSGRHLLDEGFRLVIGRSRVRIPPRAPKPQVRGHFCPCDCAAATGGHSFGWTTRSRRPSPRRYVGVRPIDSSPVDGPPSSAHSGRNCGRRTIGPALRAGRAARAMRETSLRLRRHSIFRTSVLLPRTATYWNETLIFLKAITVGNDPWWFGVAERCLHPSSGDRRRQHGITSPLHFHG
jgi:hypothetical protein